MAAAAARQVDAAADCLDNFKCTGVRVVAEVSRGRRWGERASSSPPVRGSLPPRHPQCIISRRQIIDGPVVVDVSACRYSVVREAAQELCWSTGDDEEPTPADAAVVHWMDTTVSAERLRKLIDRPAVRVNHFPGIEQLGRKKELAATVNKISRYLPQDFEFIPRSFPTIQDFHRHKRLTTPAPGSKTYYIVKPAGACMGKGISITSNPERAAFNRGVVQEYIDQPLLVDSRKCDLRCYVLLTQAVPVPQVYFYHEGFLRLCAEEYVPVAESNCGERRVHLTNYAVNRDSGPVDDNGKTGVKRSFAFFSEWLAEQGHDVDAFWRSVKLAIAKLVMAVMPSLAKSYRAACGGEDDDGQRCFELLGCDVMVDRDLKPWVIEVNHAPSLTIDSPLDRRLKVALVVDTLRSLGLSGQGPPRSWERIYPSPDPAVQETLLRVLQAAGGNRSSSARFTPRRPAATTTTTTSTDQPQPSTSTGTTKATTPGRLKTTKPPPNPRAPPLSPRPLVTPSPPPAPEPTHLVQSATPPPTPVPTALGLDIPPPTRKRTQVKRRTFVASAPIAGNKSLMAAAQVYGVLPPLNGNTSRRPLGYDSYA